MSKKDQIVAATFERALSMAEIAEATAMPLSVVKNLIGDLTRRRKLANVTGRPAKYSSRPEDLPGPQQALVERARWDFTALLQAWGMTFSAEGNG